jgi:protein-S-isoprenylcysteine O-methyltransferase Ste14
MNKAKRAPMRFPLPATLFLAAAALSLLAGALMPLPWIGRPLADILLMIGLITLLGAGALIVAAIHRMRRERTTVRPDRAAQHLVTSGVFKISRNPIYLGIAMLMFGLGLVAGQLWFFIFGLIACVILQKLAIEPEEAHLTALFGKRYRDYRKQVRRWI